MFFGVAKANCGNELFDPGGVGGKWSGAILRHWDLDEPRVKIFFADLVDVRVAVDLDVVASLSNVDAVEHIEEALTL